MFWAAAVWMLSAGPADADPGMCHIEPFDGVDFTICQVAEPADLRLWLRDAQGVILGSFARVAQEVAKEGADLAFAMNGGMYHNDRAPVGLYIENGQEVARLVTTEGPGNFGMLPNGVFCVTDDNRAMVIESRAYAVETPACRIATQSGPMLVVDGDLHPRFLPDSRSLNVRNGVGVTNDGEVIFAISNAPVSFDHFGRLFRDTLGTPNALFLDGKISKLFAPDLDRHDRGFPMGPILGAIHAK